MQIIGKKELEALKNFLVAPREYAAQKEWEATPFMKAATAAVKAVDGSAYPWVNSEKFPIIDGDLRLEVRFELTVEGDTGPDGAEADLIAEYAYKKAGAKAAKLAEGFRKALEDAGFDVQRAGDPLDAVDSGIGVDGNYVDDDGDYIQGPWKAWFEKEPCLIFEVDCLGKEGR